SAISPEPAGRRRTRCPADPADPEPNRSRTAWAAVAPHVASLLARLTPFARRTCAIRLAPTSAPATCPAPVPPPPPAGAPAASRGCCGRDSSPWPLRCPARELSPCLA